ncbi:bifunctional 3-demethylubiquinone-9 3-methyltransferase/ 2-octaprenyl-6-hydroxy phenol methylase [Maioricimonas rarisocia]|uniref:Bifunctional 3-demethylubiquinone-9 3-methyltransferase/ 2-octaprenyl-6-hydroxy phenol methylase n=1 Tax=Maioricimonas rarisocia TaxID=2528026 RepID=A0A517Z7S6_9PLAN|nr:class I SAM-dependent methyltransferase [Maioricimonas rarisocia]QDU38528.1 bifunctional 3-demethylubiquinone-9 3-methyltransferase/ 2-octaprenyl-6-hydroxy phenol methylase [Maioricimonas rarisocia]
MPEPTQGNALTTPDFWGDEFWKLNRDAVPELEIDPDHREFSWLHRFLQQHLPRRPDARLLELGCHPGRYLWYFHTYFGYEVEGVEYVAPAAELTHQALKAHDIEVPIHAADLFDFQPDSDELFDVVCSFGVVEHFADVEPVIRRHGELARPGGLVVIAIPNHAGVNGTVLKWIQPEVYAVHNHMSFRDLKDAIDANAELDYVAGGYLGHFSLAPSNLCPHLRQRLPWKVYALFERIYNGCVRVAHYLPNSRWFSPNAVVVARRRSHDTR